MSMHVTKEAIYTSPLDATAVDNEFKEPESVEPDWSQAPEGATHFDPKTKLFVKQVGQDFYCWERDNWYGLAYGIHITDELIPRPTEQPVSTDKEWDGEGLPPVGVECELKPYWEKVRIISHDGENIVFWNYRTECYEWVIDTAYFRPIETPEQKAEREREETIADALYSLPKEYHSIELGAQAERILGLLYDSNRLVKD